MLISAQQVQARVNLITGTVTDPDGGVPPAGSRVFLVSPDGDTHGEAQVDPVTGEFDLGPVVSGNYILQAHPPFGSEFTPSLPEFISMVGLPIDVGEMALMEPQITGTVYEPDGTTPVNGIVHVFWGGRPLSGNRRHWWRDPDWWSYLRHIWSHCRTAG